MARRRGRLTALLCMLAALAVAAGAAVAWQHEVAVLWHLIQLEVVRAEERPGVIVRLGRLGSPLAVPRLVRYVEGEGSPERYYAIEALGMLGSEAEAALPALVRLLIEEEDSLTSRETFALQAALPRIKAGRAAIPGLIAALAEAWAEPLPGRGVPVAVSQLFLRLEPEVIPALLHVMEHGRPAEQHCGRCQCASVRIDERPTLPVPRSFSRFGFSEA